jgi:hypothetical protein
MKAGRVVIGKKLRIASTGWLTANNHQPENQSRDVCFGDGWGEGDESISPNSQVSNAVLIQTHFHIQRRSISIG